MARCVELVPVFLVHVEGDVRVHRECHFDGTAFCQKSFEAVHCFVWVGHVLKGIVKHDDVEFAGHFVDGFLENLDSVFVRYVVFDKGVATGETFNAGVCSHEPGAAGSKSLRRSPRLVRACDARFCCV